MAGQVEGRLGRSHGDHRLAMALALAGLAAQEPVIVNGAERLINPSPITPRCCNRSGQRRARRSMKRKLLPYRLGLTG